MTQTKTHGAWNASECALVFIDYQDHTLETVFEQDIRVVELNARTLAKTALLLDIPVILSTVGVELGANGPTIPALREVLPNVKDIDRSTLDAWEDPKFLEAVKATGRNRLVMCGISTSVCLTYPSVDALLDGYEVAFVEDAVADVYMAAHDLAVLRLTQAGAVPMSTYSLMSEWFRDWTSPFAKPMRELFTSYFSELAMLKKAPQISGPSSMPSKAPDAKTAAKHAA